MSRSGYDDDIDQWAMIRWRGAVESALRGQRGQGFLREMLAALDAMEAKELIAGDLEREGAVCAIGAVGRARGLDMREIDPEDSDSVADEFDIAAAMAREIVWLNDEGGRASETPRMRWERMRTWIIARLEGDLRSAPAPAAPGDKQGDDT